MCTLRAPSEPKWYDGPDQPKHVTGVEGVKLSRIWVRTNNFQTLSTTQDDFLLLTTSKVSMNSLSDGGRLLQGE